MSLLAIYTSLPEHCTPTSQYLLYFSSAFHSCVPTSLAFLSTVLGIFSIISWLFAQIPQIYKNYQLKSASGLSIWFLMIWLLGDVSNLLGAVLTRQAGWQIFVAGYYVLMDVLMDAQYYWYTYRKLGRGELVKYGSGTERRGNGSGDGVFVGISPPSGTSTGSTHTKDTKSDTKTLDKSARSRNGQPPSRDVNNSFSKESKFPESFSQIVQRQGTFFSKGSKDSKDSKAPGSFSRTNRRQGTSSLGSSPRTLLLVPMLCVVLAHASPLQLQIEDELPATSLSEIIGSIFSWCSTVLYLGSRLPQIYKNFNRRSTEGLSPALFLAAFLGNFFYSASVMTNPLAWDSYPPYGLHGWVGPDGSDMKTWRALAAPFWLGAAGVLVLDATVGVQFLIFGEGGAKKSVLVEDHRGRSRWRRVSGWMRGWVPSPSLSAAESTDDGDDNDDDDARRLLDRMESHSNYGTT